MLQFLSAYGIYEIVKAVSVELVELIFKDDVIYLSMFDGEFNLSRFMKHIFIGGIIILIIILYNNSKPVSTPVSKPVSKPTSKPTSKPPSKPNGQSNSNYNNLSHIKESFKNKKNKISQIRFKKM